MQYTYDESGVTFNYFILSVLVIIVLPTTFSYISASDKNDKEVPKGHCHCDDCLKKRASLKVVAHKQKGFSWKPLLLLLGWALLCFIVYEVATTTVDQQLWDPYEIMGLDSSASFAEIKKQYRRLSLQWHPDKVEESQKEAAEAVFIDISKAYKVLTDEDARRNWEEFGHPDGKQSLSLGIALPSWLVSEGSSSLVLLVYGLVFGIGLPVMVARWWGSSKSTTKDKLMIDTMNVFYKEMKEMMPPKAQLDLISIAMEFRPKIKIVDPKQPDPAEAKLEKLIKDAMEEKGNGDKFDKPKRYMQQIPWSARVSLLLYSHLLRVPLDDPEMEEERIFVVEKSAHLMNGLLQIALARFHATTIFTIIELGQFIHQGLYYKEHPFMLLPGMKKEHIRHFTSKKIQTFRDLLVLDDEKRNNIMRFLSDPERDAAIYVARQYPFIVVDRAVFAVLGDPAITPSSIVTLTVVIRKVNTQKTSEAGALAESTGPDKDTPVEEMVPKAWWKAEEVGPFAHAPLFPKDVRERWWVFLVDSRVNKFVCPPGLVKDLNTHKTIRFQFQAPPKPGKIPLHLFIKSESCVGCDINAHEVQLVVDSASAVPQDVEEDDISDPDEDTFAGQLAAARGATSTQTKQQKVNGTTSSKSNKRNKEHPNNKRQQDDGDHVHNSSSDSDSD
ncbi:hypothetical protein SeMB42_g03886 [Synchytrium endobioticum]|uniref:J domain-containing protein n=1 Tax=Synchytrium endobioticum TaxID=286115 RepID=A0A507D351_9FUNG|nr:hypothetical protein SeLEV6574_g07982 [Synchytrium endobioticum]TPX45731.1 hypothetical protein SeMB42_g03886 [Synchytrium endobioticum]